MKKHKIQKKEYKRGILNNAFAGCMSLTLVLETNLLSRTLNISTELLYFIGVCVMLFWNISIFIKLNRAHINRVSSKATLLSNNSKKSYERIKKVGWAPSIIILGGIMVNNGNYKFVFFSTSVVFILFVKHYLFDNIIIFTEEGYHSGFDRMKITKKTIIVELERSLVLMNEEFVTFEIYANKKRIAFDKFFDTDYQYLYKMAHHSKYT